MSDVVSGRGSFSNQSINHPMPALPTSIPPSGCQAKLVSYMCSPRGGRGPGCSDRLLPVQEDSEQRKSYHKNRIPASNLAGISPGVTVPGCLHLLHTMNTLALPEKDLMVEVENASGQTANGLTVEENPFLAAFPPERRKKVLRKIDIRLIPLLTLFYLLSYIDRANIGMFACTGRRRPELIRNQAMQRSKASRKIST